MRRTWQGLRPSLDGGLAFGAIREHLIASAWQDMTFDTLEFMHRRLLEQAPVLGDLGYGWTPDRVAYDFPAEALDQFRVLQTVAGLHGQAGIEVAGLRRIAVRETLAWQGERSRPRAFRSGGWRYIVSPFGWDNMTELTLRAFVGHGLASGFAHPLFREGAHADWKTLAKGLVVNAGTVSRVPVIVDSVLSEAALGADPWLADAVISMASFVGDGVVRCLASLVADFSIGHEVAHHALHGDRFAKRDTVIEIEADRAALSALWRWDFARDVSALPDRSSNYWDFASALLCLMVVVTGSLVDRALSGVPAPEIADELEARTSALFDLARFNPSASCLSPEDMAEFLELAAAFNAFLQDLSTFVSGMPASAREALPRVAEEGATAFIATLEGHLRE